MYPQVVILGRPNVGKSTLFNRITRSRRAIVDPTPGITRDCLISEVEWEGKRFNLIDTGGLDLFTDDSLFEKVRERVLSVVEEADVLLFVVDAKTGVSPLDEELIQLIRRYDKPFILVVNKIDEEKHLVNLYQFYELGLSEVIPISAEHNRGIGRLLDRVVSLIPSVSKEEEPEEETKLVVVGRPNVGKSTLVNRLIGEEKVLVHEKPGTTRDAVDLVFSYKGKRYRIIDTAGIRRKSRIKERFEVVSVLKARGSLERAEVAILLLDAEEGITSQDVAIAHFTHSAGVGLVIAMNKWDLLPKRKGLEEAYRARIKERLKPIDYSPILFISAKEGRGVYRAVEAAEKVAENRRRRIPTGVLNQFLRGIISRYRPPASRKGFPKIYYGTQVSVSPPTFVLFVNDPDRISKNYLRYLKNRFREAFDFTGTPLVIKLRKSE
ncbi:MAG: ribosome biogenesis GTPase Der [Acidobacteria bacterium]|nr:ribosome biogenesis GTPase Der [Acidobacteriota bacterium]